MDRQVWRSCETPYKYGKPVIAGSGIAGNFDANAVDCPFVFYHQGKFQMMYIGFDGTGYQTALAQSDDLVHWRFRGMMLDRREDAGWDKVGAAGTWIIRETNDLRALPTLKKIDGKYWMVYHAYPEQGYETGSASIGLAWCDDEDLLRWHRLDKPVLMSRDGAKWEKGGLYKACVVCLDGRYYMFYNAKNRPSFIWKEQTGIAVSEDLLHWKRYEGNPVIQTAAAGWDSVFCSDPCVVRDGDEWLLFYFGFNGMHAQEGLAVSEDLLKWKKFKKPILRHGKADELDGVHAHKPSVVFYNGTLYHFYCACRKSRPGDPTVNFGREFRCITVAASTPFARA